ncbi:MAG: hypothetical protein HYS81_01310 [Candidatus Aenigmatarchaeota archaeon]|nr:MAG: hypothetical protein HYS81_01310 [Candidatus Aenigmarchaeota archaeon]
MLSAIRLEKGDLAAEINELNAQLYSLARRNADGKPVEFMWGGGSPDPTAEERTGWQNSEVLMGPTVGPSRDDAITIGGTRYPMQQHGLLRDLDWIPDTDDTGDDYAIFAAHYDAGTPVPSRKNPNVHSIFPFSFAATKKYALRSGELSMKLQITNTSREPMPYAAGWHPAFRTSGRDLQETIDAGTGPWTLLNTRRKTAANGCIKFPGSNSALYKGVDRTVEISSDFGNTMVWAPEGQKQVCIEPVTALSSSEHDGELSERPGYILLEAGRAVTYRAEIDPQLAQV